MTWVKPSALTLKKTASKKEEEKKKIKIEQKADKKENMKKKVRGGKKRSEVKTSMTSTVEVVRASSSEVEEDGVHGRSLGIDSILQKKKMPGPMVTTSLGGGTILTRKQLSDQGVIVVDNPFLTNKKDKPAQKSGVSFRIYLFFSYFR